VLNRDLRYVETDPADTLAQMTSYGMPEKLAYRIVEMFRSTLEAYNSKLTADITTVTNQPARSFTDWVRAHGSELVTPAAS